MTNLAPSQSTQTPRLTRWSCLGLLIAVAFTQPAPAQDATGIKAANLKGADLDLMNNHDPNSELENFELLPGYQANLFASDPMIANPVHMHWDSKGRLWVACSWAYPPLKPGEKANDKIIILEDTDDDGKADKSTVFADGLYLPTGIEFANGGCYVAQSPDIFFLKDTDGDDVADTKELVLTGFGIEDSHHSISAWRRGPGGWLYFQEGIFLHTQVETQYGVVRNFNGGVYQFNPRTRELRMFCRGTGGNPWGHVFDQWGQSFMVNNPRILYLSPASGNSGEIVPVKPLISTEKQCGGDLASGSHVGDDIRGQLLTGRFKSRTVVRYEFIEEGAGFACNVLSPLIASKHPNFRPVDVKVGPRGAIYVADWYNSIINHAGHDFRDERRDHDHGRIWRITHKNRPLTEKPELVGKSVASLVDQLRSQEDWTRHQARSELSLRDPDEVLAVAEAWSATLDPEDTDSSQHLVEAMWACQNVGRVSEPILKQVLAAKDGHARSAGARAIRYWHKELSDPIGMIAKAAADPFPRTRMEAVLSAGFIPQAESLTAALNSLDHPGDPILDQALPQTMIALENHWRPAMENGTLQFAAPSHREYVQSNAGGGLDRQLSKFLRKKSPSADEILAIKTQLQKVGTEADIQMAFNALTRGGGLASDDATIALLQAFESVPRSKRTKSLQRKMRSLKTLLDHKNKDVALLAARNLGVWRMAGRDELARISDTSLDALMRQALAVSIAKTSPKYTAALSELYASEDVSTRQAALVGLAHASVSRAIEMASQEFATETEGLDPVAVVQAIIKQKGGGASFAKALDGVALHPSVTLRVAEFHRMSGQLPIELAERFQSNTGDRSLTAELLAEDLQNLHADVVRLGNPERGEEIYRRKSLACTNCHAIGAAGPVIGPNLVAVGGASKPGYLEQSILKPSAIIAEHYENKKFLLADGSVQTGIVTFQSDKEVVVRDATNGGKEIRIDADEIELEQPQPSAMPSGLADQLKDRTEFLDLAKFLTVLGTPGPYANDESPVVRKWQLASSERGDVLPDNDAMWTTAYSKVNGELPAADFSESQWVFAKGAFNVQVAGQLELDINSLVGLTLRVDGVQINDFAHPIDVKRGRHTLTFGINKRERQTTGLRVKLNPADTKVRFQPEGGQ